METCEIIIKVATAILAGKFGQSSYNAPKIRKGDIIKRGLKLRYDSLEAAQNQNYQANWRLEFSDKLSYSRGDLFVIFKPNDQGMLNCYFFTAGHFEKK